MANSMTGFGCGEARKELVCIAVEIRSVNHRFGDVRIRLPKTIASLEGRLRDMVGQTLLRGKIDVFVTIEDQSDNQIQIRVNRPLVRAWLAAFRELGDELAVNTIDTSFLLGQPDVFQIEACEIDQEEAWRMLEAATGEALRQIQQMRRQEGEKLAQDIRSKGETLSRLRKQAERSETVVDAYRERLMSRVEQILGDDKDACYDEQRIAAEVAIYADKCSVDEELVRLASHLQQLNDILLQDGSIGKQLDFLLQEINREINTIGSKSSDLALTKLVLEMKNEAEKIREQVQNLE